MSGAFLAKLGRRPDLALLLAGAAALGAGLALSRWAALRTTVDLHPQESLQQLPDGRTLPFTLRLDAMAVDGPEAPARLIVRDGTAEVALDPVPGASTMFAGHRLSLERALPRAVPESTFAEQPAGPENPVVHLLLGLGTPAPLEGYLVAKDPERRRFDEPGGRFAVIHAERWEPALLDELRPRPGTLVFSVGGRAFTHAATPGVWSFPGFDLRIVEVFPDLGLAQGKGGAPEAFHRSRLPRNPWVLVRVAQKGGSSADLLIAATPPSDPSYKAALEAVLPPGSDLRYDRTGEELVSRFVVLTPDGRARLVEHGALQREEAPAPGQPFLVAKGLSVTVLEWLQHGRMRTVYREAEPGALGTPALAVRAAGKGGDTLSWVGLERPEVEVPGTALHLRYGPPAPAADAVRARISLLDAGASPRVQRTLTGEETLELDGYRLSLGRGASQTGRWVRLSLVRDPWWMLQVLGGVLFAGGIGLFLRASRKSRGSNLP